MILNCIKNRKTTVANCIKKERKRYHNNMNLTNLKVEATDMRYAKSWILVKKKKIGLLI